MRLFAERHGNEDQQRYCESAKNAAGNDDIPPHLQSLFQLPFFQINQKATRIPIRASTIAIGIPISQIMRFPNHDSKTSDCRASAIV